MLNLLQKTRLVYGHSIADPEKTPFIGPERKSCVAPEKFDNFLARCGHKVSLTLDDGFLDNLTIALPILEKHDVRAKIFVTTGFVDRSHVPMERLVARVAETFKYKDEDGLNLLNILGLQLEKADEPQVIYYKFHTLLKSLSLGERIQYRNKLMKVWGGELESLVKDILTPEQVAELENHPLISIGAHTVSHPNLRCLKNGELMAELVESKKALEEWIGRPVTDMAYPYGDLNKRVQRAVIEAGYQSAYTTEPRGWRRFVPAFNNPFAMLRYDLKSVIKKEIGDDKR